MKLIGNRVLVSKVEEEKKEGFQTVDVQDSFVNKGKIEQTGESHEIIYTQDAKNFSIKDLPFKEGDIVLFAKYSPDTHEFEHEGKKYKSVKVEDILVVL